MGVPRAAHVAPAARDVTLGADVIALSDARDPGAQLLDVSGELVTLDQRHLDPGGRPRVPIVDVDAGAADGRDVHANQDFRGSRLRDRDFPAFRALLLLI